MVLARVVYSILTSTLPLQPQSISGRRLGVAAVTWDGAFVLALFLKGKAGIEVIDNMLPGIVLEMM